jgi:hypothetical protein
MHHTRGKYLYFCPSTPFENCWVFWNWNWCPRMPILNLAVGGFRIFLLPKAASIVLSPNLRSSNPGFKPGFTPRICYIKGEVNPRFGVLKCEPCTLYSMYMYTHCTHIVHNTCTQAVMRIWSDLVHLWPNPDPDVWDPIRIQIMILVHSIGTRCKQFCV